MSGPGLDRRILLAFAAIVLIAGSNIVAVRLSNRELEPFWGAGIRFAVGTTILWALVVRGRAALPHGRDLVWTAGYGLLNFFAAYAFFYWGAQEVPAGLGGTIMASVPLLTVLLAAAHGAEPLRARAVVGATIAIAGVAVISWGGLSGDVRAISVLAIGAAAIAAAESGVFLEVIPSAHPVVTNAVGMSVGAAALLGLSAAIGETWQPPRSPSVWAAVVYLAISSPILFMLFVYVIRRWSASATSFQFVLFPIVAVIGGALVLGEPITPSLLLGAPLVLAGVYVGALSDRSRRMSTSGGPVRR